MATKAPRLKEILQKLGSQVLDAPGRGALKCYYKPFRRVPRTFNAKSVARVVCAAIRDGTPQQEIRLEMQRCLQCTEDNRANRAVAEALAALQQTQVLLDLVVTVLVAIAAVIGTIQLVGRFVPQARLILVAAAPAFNRISVFTGTVIARKAANDVIIAALRRAA